MDKHIEKVIKEVAVKLKVKEELVEEIVKNYFNWQRTNMIEHSQEIFYLPYFGKFSIIEKRYEAWLTSQKDNNKSNNKLTE